MTPYDVNSRTDLETFLEELSRDVSQFQNQDLGEFLAAASRWVADMDGYFENRGESMPLSSNWSIFAMILTAATMYD
jgi:hypothetical protein